MLTRRMLAVALLAMTATAVPASADPVYDTLVQLEDSAYRQVMGIERLVDRLGTTTVTPPTPPPSVVTLNYYTDAVSIADYGSGPVIEYRGVLGNPALWSCNRTYGGGSSVVVTCDANPSSGITWQCGVMHVTATALVRPSSGYRWAADSRATSTRRAPSVPNPERLERGKVVGHVSCNGQSLMTAQANKDAPHQTATAAMSAVTRLVCEARLSQSSATAPVTAYAVNCVDPANPTG